MGLALKIRAGPKKKPDRLSTIDCRQAVNFREGRFTSKMTYLYLEVIARLVHQPVLAAPW